MRNNDKVLQFKWETAFDARTRHPDPIEAPDHIETVSYTVGNGRVELTSEARERANKHLAMRRAAKERL